MKIKKSKKLEIIEPIAIIPETVEGPTNVSRKEIGKLAIDYSSESLNDMARKINEIIDYINAL